MLQRKGSYQKDLKLFPDPGQARESAKWLILLCLLTGSGNTSYYDLKL